jgi:peroxin-11C
MIKHIKTLETVINLLNNSSGRDKLCRIIQYSSKFVKAFFLYVAVRYKNPMLKELADKSDFIGGSMGMTRKVLRFGRPIGISYNIFKLIKTYQKRGMNPDEFDKTKNTSYVVLKVISDASLFLYFLFDHLLYFKRIGVLKDSKLIQFADYVSNLSWLIECLADILCDCIDIHLLQKRAQKEMALEPQKNYANISKEITDKTEAAIVDILRSIIDVPIAIHFMNDKFLSPGFVGILGTITSYLGLYQIWPSAVPK